MSFDDGEHRRLDGRYEIREIIGHGGMSTVYRSYDHRTGRDVAVKVFRAGPELADADERFRREVMLLAGLRDPGIVTVFDAEFDVATPYLVTELVDGPTLSQRIGRAPLTEAQVVHLGAALARALAYVHAHGIVHRDVKPSNILLPDTAEDPFAAPKLVDFGIAIAAEAARLTAANLTLGTANYLSPEQFRGDPLTPATDVYSLGLVLIEALTGQPAYPGTGAEAATARLDHPPAIPAVTSATLRAALTDMTAADPEDRPGAAQVAHRLGQLDSSRTRQILPRRGGAAPAPPLGTPGVHVAGRAHRRRPRSLPVAAAALIIAALAGVAAVAGVISHKPGPANQTPGYAAPTSGSPRPPTHTKTGRPPSPTWASAPQQVGNPAPSAAASTTPSRRSAITSGRLPAPPKTSIVSKTFPSPTPTPTSPSAPASSSGPSSPSAPTSPSSPGSPSTSPATSPPPSPTP